MGFKVLHGSIPREDEKSGKTFWDSVGFTAFLAEDGKLSMVDARSGKKIYFFEREQNQDQRPAQKPKATADFYANGGDPLDF
jgi:hypothetical protein